MKIRSITTLKENRNTCDCCGNCRIDYTAGPTMYRIDMVVTPQGHYITLDGLYETEKSAQKEIDRINEKS